MEVIQGKKNDLTSLATAWRGLCEVPLSAFPVCFAFCFHCLGGACTCVKFDLFFCLFLFCSILKPIKIPFSLVSNCFPFSFVHSACFCFPIHVMFSVAPPAASSYFSFPPTPSSNCFPLFPPLHHFFPTLLFCLIFSVFSSLI